MNEQEDKKDETSQNQPNTILREERGEPGDRTGEEGKPGGAGGGEEGGAGGKGNKGGKAGGKRKASSERKAGLLDKIRSGAKSTESNGSSGTPPPEDGHPLGSSEGDPPGGKGNSGGSESGDGTPLGSNSSSGPAQPGSRKSNNSSRKDSPGKQEQGVKPKVSFGGGLGGGSFAKAGSSLPSLSLDDTLTDKEAKDMLPKFKGVLSTLFGYADKGISLTNRRKAEAYIWSSINEEELEILASHFVELAKKSKVVATAVKKLTSAHRMLQINLITLPRFYQTYLFYQNNGGFSLFGNPMELRQSGAIQSGNEG